jgi:hypothetical protein
MKRNILLKFFVCILTLALVISTTPISSVHATSVPPPHDDTTQLIQNIQQAGHNGWRVFAQMTPAQQAQVTQALTVSTITTKVSKTEPDISSISPLASTSCKGQVISLLGYSVVNIHVWTYSQTFEWCYNGTKITSTFAYPTGTVYVPLYSFKNIIETSGGGVGSTSYSYYTEGEFAFCLAGPWTGCVQYSYPWIRQTGYYNGAYTSSDGH